MTYLGFEAVDSRLEEVGLDGEGLEAGRSVGVGMITEGGRVEGMGL